MWSARRLIECHRERPETGVPVQHTHRSTEGRTMIAQLEKEKATQGNIDVTFNLV